MVKITFLVFGLVVGLTAGILIQQPRTQPGRAFVERCRVRKAWVDALPPAEREAFLDGVRKCSEERVAWSVVYACARIETGDSE